jgi:hypothetical protein
MFTMKILERMMKIYSNQITISECSNIRIDNFFKDLNEKTTFLTDGQIVDEK